MGAKQRQIFEWEKLTSPETLTDIQRAARFYYLQNMAFGAKVEGQTYGTSTTSPPRLNLLRLEENLSAAHLRLSRTQIEHLDWATCIEKYDRPHSLFYLDPPYWGTSGYGVKFGLEQYARMATLAGAVKGKMIISVNDISQMRRVFEGFTLRTVDVTYSLGDNRQQASELLITNFAD